VHSGTTVALLIDSSARIALAAIGTVDSEESDETIAEAREEMLPGAGAMRHHLHLVR
jgi:hypothetical protein